MSSPSRICASIPDDPYVTPQAAVRHLASLSDAVARRETVILALGRLSADALLPLLKDESERLLNIAPHDALALAETLVFAGEYAERPSYRALGMMATGDALRVLGRYRESVEAMDEAGATYRALDDEVGWARTRNGWLRSAHRLGRGGEALAEADRALAILVRHGLAQRAATLEYNAAFVCADIGQFDDALARYDRAQALCQSAGEAAERASALARYNEASLRAQLGDYDGALRLHDQARPVLIRHGATQMLMRQDDHIARIHAARGHYTRALHLHTAARASFEAAGLDVDVAWTCLYMAECYLRLNRYPEVRDAATRAIAMFEQCGASTEAATARIYVALSLVHDGDTAHALALLATAARVFAAAGFAAQGAFVALQRAMLHLEAGDTDAAWVEATRAHATFAAHGETVREAQADILRARIALRRGDLAGAATCARAALAVGEARDVPWLAHEAHHCLGSASLATGDLGGALDAYDRAVQSVERVQVGLTVELRTHFLADKVYVFEDAIAASLRAGDPVRAFAYLERAKSRALVDYLAGNTEVRPHADADADPALVDALARLREEHHGLYHRLHGSGLMAGENGGVSVPDDTLREAIRGREREIARLMEQLALQRTGGRGASGVAPDASDALPALAPGTVLVEYFLAGTHGVAFVIADGKLSLVPLVARPTDLTRLLRHWQHNLAATAQAIVHGAALDGLGRNARGVLGALYRALVAPVAPFLAGREQVIFVPYGATHAVPFHALHDGVGYLIESVEVVTCPSSDLLRLCAAQPPAAPRALVLAHNEGGQLPAVRTEAEVVARLFPGECHMDAAATRRALAAAAPEHGIVHLAAHGEARLDNPTFAYLQLADGHLGVADVFNLRLRGALVALSGCETGRGAVVGGDEVVGLSRGFLHAGAAALVQSLWRVEDGTTADLMEHFYRALRDGRTKGDALREAQRALLASHGVHPYFWAPFQLVGDTRPLATG